MRSVICTLFEGHYHYGLAVLTNSLYRNGYRGHLFVGYKGNLPPWATLAKNNTTLLWEGGKTLLVAEGLQLHFLPVESNYSLTNYKPDFMLRLWDGLASDTEQMFYFDPDIVIVRSWLLFEEWATCGVAVSEDANSPLSKFHPRRVAWRRYFMQKEIALNYKEGIYVNGGFVGLSLENKNFLNIWKEIQETMAPLIGGLDQSIFKKGPITLLEKAGGPFMPFLKTDQDALNATIEAAPQDISFMGKEGMGFDNGGYILMYHAVGRQKPWRWQTMRQSIAGKPPRKVDVEFWNFANGPIVAMSKGIIYRRKMAIKIAAGIGRLYRKN